MVLVLFFDSCTYDPGNLRHGVEVIGGKEGGKEGGALAPRDKMRVIMDDDLILMGYEQ